MRDAGIQRFCHTRDLVASLIYGITHLPAQGKVMDTETEVLTLLSVM